VLAVTSAIVPYATIPVDRALDRREKLDGDWRREPDPASPDRTPLDALVRWFVRRHLRDPARARPTRRSLTSSPGRAAAVCTRPSLASSCGRGDTGMVLTMTEPQVWVLIGVFAAGIFGMFTIISTLFIRVIRTEIRAEVGGLRGEMMARFDVLEQRVDGLDRDLQALVKHTFGLDRG
jgi:hypothetical protein